MKIGIVYTSVSGNTEQLAKLLMKKFQEQSCTVYLYRLEEFHIEWIHEFDIFLIGTYTWGNGNIPKKMQSLYQELQHKEFPSLVTGVFGTGDSFFPHFCGAVDRFRDLLKHHTNLAVTLNVELFPQPQDEAKCVLFTKKCISRVKDVMVCSNNKNRLVN